MLTFDGRRDDFRRDGTSEVILPTGEALTFGVFRKTALTRAVQVPVPFEVETLEGLHTAPAGAYLAIGPAGEMYPIQADIFEATYQPA